MLCSLLPQQSAIGGPTPDVFHQPYAFHYLESLRHLSATESRWGPASTLRLTSKPLAHLRKTRFPSRTMVRGKGNSLQNKPSQRSAGVASSSRFRGASIVSVFSSFCLCLASLLPNSFPLRFKYFGECNVFKAVVVDLTFDSNVYTIGRSYRMGA